MNPSEYAQERDMFDISSSFTSLLGTDFVPNDEEAAKIGDFLASGPSKLARISSEITRVKLILQELENQHKAVEDEMDAHRALLSPLRRELIPMDILQEIFLSCLPRDHDSIISNKEAPVLFTQVCSSWRRIALNTPLLWSSIHVPIPYPSPTVGGQQAAMDLIMVNRVNAVREWLKRSQDCPLSFTLEGNWAAQHCNDLLDLLLPESIRWQRVDMAMAQHQISIVMRLDPRKTPLLRSIRMRSTRLTGGLVEDMGSEEYLNQFSLFQSTDLRTLSIANLPVNSATLPLKWSQLSHLFFDQNDGPLDISQILGMLKACIRLRSFQLTVPILDNATPTENPSSFKITDSLVSLPFLTKFSVVLTNIEYNISYPGPTIFDSIELPVLNDVKFIWGHYSEGPPPLLSFLRNHGRTVTKLSTNTTHLFSQENLISCLRCCPNLIELRIEDTDIRRLGNAMIIDYHFLKKLSAADNSGEILCPQLELLDSPVWCSDQEVLDFLSKKQGLNVPWLSKLKLLRLKFSREQEQPLAKAVQPFVDEGLCLALDYHTREPRTQVTFKNGSAYNNLRLPSSGLLREGTILF